MEPFDSIEDMADAFGFAETLAERRKEEEEHEQFYDTLEHADGIPPDLNFE